MRIFLDFDYSKLLNIFVYFGYTLEKHLKTWYNKGNFCSLRVVQLLLMKMEE